MTVLFFYLRHQRCLRLGRRAVTSIEYALIASLIAVAVVAGTGKIGHSVATTFNNVSGEL